MKGITVNIRHEKVSHSSTLTYYENEVNCKNRVVAKEESLTSHCWCFRFFRKLKPSPGCRCCTCRRYSMATAICSVTVK